MILFFLVLQFDLNQGDLVDRGADTIAVYKLFQKLRPQAAAAGGEVNEWGSF